MSKGIFSHVSGTTYYQYSELTLHESFLRLLNYQFRLFNSWDTNMNYLPVFIVQLLVVFIICKFFEILLQNKLKTTNKNELYVFFKKNPFLLSLVPSLFFLIIVYLFSTIGSYTAGSFESDTGHIYFYSKRYYNLLPALPLIIYPFITLIYKTLINYYRGKA